MIFLILILTISSFMFGNRIADSMFERKLITTFTKHLIEFTFFVTWMGFFLIFGTNFALAVVLTLVWILFFVCLSALMDVFRSRKLRSCAESFLDRTILNMLGGNSFRSSCLEAAKLGDAFSQHEIDKILDSVFFRPQVQVKFISEFSPFLRNELQQMDSQPHTALTKLKGLRRNLSLESEFRQRSEQIRGRVWIQSGFMLGLYIAVLAFIWSQGVNLDTASLFLSLALFLVGFAWTIMDGRKMKWRT